MAESYFVYILTNKFKGTLYVGVTNNIQRRIAEHKLGLVDGFTKKYSLKKLVYFQEYKYIDGALNYEKKLKRWHREWKINLIEKDNPNWSDLFYKYFRDPETSSG